MTCCCRAGVLSCECRSALTHKAYTLWWQSKRLRDFQQTEHHDTKRHAYDQIYQHETDAPFITHVCTKIGDAMAGVMSRTRCAQISAFGSRQAHIFQRPCVPRLRIHVETCCDLLWMDATISFSGQHPTCTWLNLLRSTSPLIKSAILCQSRHATFIRIINWAHVRACVVSCMEHENQTGWDGHTDGQRVTSVKSVLGAHNTDEFSGSLLQE